MWVALANRKNFSIQRKKNVYNLIFFKKNPLPSKKKKREKETKLLPVTTK